MHGTWKAIISARSRLFMTPTSSLWSKPCSEAHSPLSATLPELASSPRSLSSVGEAAMPPPAACSAAAKSLLAGALPFCGPEGDPQGCQIP